MKDDSDDEEDVEEEPPKLSREEQEERMSKLVQPLSADEWGAKTSTRPSVSSNVTSQIAPMSEPSRPKMRPPVFAKQEYDGVLSDSDESEDESSLPPPGTLGRKIAQMKWSEGTPKIQTLEEEEEAENRERKFGLGDDIDEAMERAVWGEEEAPVVVEGDGDVDMGEEEEEFLKFTREALGISPDMWESIISDRKGRGGESIISCLQRETLTLVIAFVPESKPTIQAQRQTQGVPTRPSAHSQEPSNSLDSSKQLPHISGGKNMELNSFDRVMQAMDEELAKKKGLSTSSASVEPKSAKPQSTPKSKSKGKGKAHSAKTLATLPTEADLDDMSEDELEAMDRELREALKGMGDDEGELDMEEAKGLEGDEKREYAMMRDFLESYQSQGGGSGAVGNLFGRLGQAK
jgi:hypothetical protein